MKSHLRGGNHHSSYQDEFVRLGRWGSLTIAASIRQFHSVGNRRWSTVWCPEVDEAMHYLTTRISKMTHHFSGPVPASERRSPLTLGLIWITMVTFFPSVVAGFQWFKEGISMPQAIVGTICSCLILIAYTTPICCLASRTGLGYAELNRRIFGPSSCLFLNFNILWIFTAWYGFTALCLAEGLTGLFHWHLPLTLLACVLGLAMAFNNFFGFKGIANFARYFAAPILVAWVLYSFFKTVPTCPVAIMHDAGRVDLSHAITIISTFVIGIAVWGNEADYWRYGKPRLKAALIPLSLSLLIGQILFPLTGWMLARMTGITDYGPATEFLNNYSFAGIAVIGGLVLAASQFAANDSNLFGSTLALKAIKSMSHKKSVVVLAGLGTITAAWLASFGAAKALESIAALNCVFLPAPTVIVLTEIFLIRKFLCRNREHEWGVVGESSSASKQAALLALMCGIVVGVATSGVVPQLASWHVGICPLQSWVTSLLVYLPLRVIQERRRSSVMVRELVRVPVSADDRR